MPCTAIHSTKSPVRGFHRPTSWNNEGLHQSPYSFLPNPDGESFVTVAVYEAEHRIYNPIVLKISRIISDWLSVYFWDRCNVHSKIHFKWWVLPSSTSGDMATHSSWTLQEELNKVNVDWLSVFDNVHTWVWFWVFKENLSLWGLCHQMTNISQINRVNMSKIRNVVNFETPLPTSAHLNQDLIVLRPL